jgi:hypothetical protein
MEFFALVMDAQHEDGKVPLLLSLPEVETQ